MIPFEELPAVRKLREQMRSSDKGLYYALRLIAEAHLGDQPAHHPGTEYDWAVAHIKNLRRIARDGIAAYCEAPAPAADLARLEASQCPDCDGFGMCWNNADPTSGQWHPCKCGDERGQP